MSIQMFCSQYCYSGRSRKLRISDLALWADAIPWRQVPELLFWEVVEINERGRIMLKSMFVVFVALVTHLLVQPLSAARRSTSTSRLSLRKRHG